MSKKPKVYFQFRNKNLNVLFVRGAGLSFQAISTREVSRESLLDKLKELGGGKPPEAVLVVPREEVLSQEFEVASSAETLKKNLRERLEKSFPYRLEELSYGVRVMEQSDEKLKGTLVAATKEKLDEWMRLIEGAGFILSEIISTDEALFGFYKSAKVPLKRTILFDLGEAALECLFVLDGKIRFSRAFSPDTPNLLREVGLLTLEFEGFEKIYVCGRQDASFDAALQAQFQMPGQRLIPPVDGGGRELPASLYGALFVEDPYVSLLPSERKLRKKAGERKRAFFGAMAALACFTAVLGVFFFFHLKALEMKSARLDKQLEALAPEYKEARRMHGVLKMADKRYSANQEKLSLFRELAIHMPPQAALTKISLDSESLSLQGESSDNSSIADLLTLLKRQKGVSEPKLEYARLKDKELGKDSVFEFLIEAKRL